MVSSGVESPQHLQHVLGLEQLARLGLLVDEGVSLLPAADLRAPGPAVGLGRGAPAALEGLDQLGDHQLAVSPYGHIGCPNLAQLGLVDVDVDHLGVGREAVEAPGDPVVEAGTERDEQVRALHGGDRGVVAVHPGHAQAQLVAVGEAPPGHERGDHRHVDQLGQGAQLGRGPGLEDPAPGVDHGALGFTDQLGRGLNQFGIAHSGGAVSGELHDVVGGLVPGHGRARVAGVDDVLGDVHQDRPRPSGGGDVEGLVDDAGNVLGLGDQKVVLGDRQGDSGGVALLEGVGAYGGVGHLAGDAHHRDRVHVGVAQRGDDVGGARSRGDHRHAGAPGGVGVALGHVPRALLVAHQYVAYRRLDDRVVHGQDGSAGQPEYHFHALSLEGLNQGLSAVHVHVGPPGRVFGMWFPAGCTRNDLPGGGLRTIGWGCERALSGQYFHEHDSVDHSAKYGP